MNHHEASHVLSWILAESGMIDGLRSTFVWGGAASYSATKIVLTPPISERFPHSHRLRNMATIYPCKPSKKLPGRSPFAPKNLRVPVSDGRICGGVDISDTGGANTFFIPL
jgi:hypothetical protein